MKRLKIVFRQILSLILLLMFAVNGFAAIVSDNDGSAFVTKAEFEALKKDFADQVDNYNSSIDAKIDGAISAYLAGIKVSSKYVLTSIINNINALGFNYNNMGGWPFTNSNIAVGCTDQQQEVYIGGTFAYQNLTEVSGDWSTCHHAAAGRANHKVQNGAGTAWRYVKLHGVKCLESYMNLYESLNYAVSFGAAYHDGNNRGLKHTWQYDISNSSNNLNVEVKNHFSSTSAWYYKNPSGSWSSRQGLSSGSGMLVLSKKIVNTVNSAKKGYASPMNQLPTTTGMMYNSETDLETLLTFTKPGTSTSNETGHYVETFPSPLFWNCFRGASCVWYSSSDQDYQKPVTQNASDDVYWRKQYINTESFNIRQVYAYAPTSAYGEPVTYYNGLPICKNDAGQGTLTFRLKPVATGGGTTLANQIKLCFRDDKFDNYNPYKTATDYAKNLKNVKYRQKGATTWNTVDSTTGVTSNWLTPGTEYEIMIEDFPEGKTLWVKAGELQNSSSTSTQVYAYITTTSDIVIEVD